MNTQMTKAMILAAGFGTRLKPLTDNTPKALVPYNGKPMIQNVIEKLRSEGINEIVVNTHYLHEQVEEFFRVNSFGVKVTLTNESEILETGGGIKNAKWFLKDSENFLVYNTDIDCDLNLGVMYEYHLKRNPLATIAVKERKTSRPLLFDVEKNLAGRVIENQEYIYGNWSSGLTSSAFCGIHIISSRIFTLFPNENKFDIISFYMDMVKAGEKISGYDIENYSWKDLGSAKNLSKK